MRKLTLLAGCFLLLAGVASAQVSGGGKPFSFTYALADNFETTKVIMPVIDVQALRKKANETYVKGEMLPAGQIFPASLTPENSGTWTLLPNGDRVWRLLIQVPRAPATSLYFDNFYIPEGGLLYVYNTDKTQVIGSFGTHNNHESKLFATEIVYTENCVVEYYEKANVKRRGSFTITGIANIYNAPASYSHSRLEVFGSSGSCEVNVNCPEGAAWTNQRNSVARILIRNGSSVGWCSGALINNIPQACKNYFLTANHCGAGASAADKNQWIFYFNYQSSGCANPTNEPGSNTITGCTMRASSSNGANSDYNGSDFLLVEFNSAIPAAYNVYYAGFDASGGGTTGGGVGIHHPAADIKKISSYTAPLVSSSYNGMVADSHWEATWVATTTNHGVTEGGSSGSPLFNASDSRIVGQLSGGKSSCTTIPAHKIDYYGKLSYSWTTNGTTPSHQLKPWLDPGNSGNTVVGGKASCVTGCSDIMEPNNTQGTANFIQINVSYPALIATGTDQDYYKFTVGNGTNIVVSLTNLPFDYDLQLLNSAGTVVGSSNAGSTTNENITYNNAPAGTYTVRVWGYNGAFSAAVCYSLFVTLTSACTNTPEPNESLAAASTISANMDLNSQIATNTDVDWYRFTNLAGAANIYITLTNLPFDYDVYLYNSAGSQIGSSSAGGTTNEAIIYNTSVVGTYYIWVRGYNSAFSTTQCYRLRAEISGTPKSAMVRSAAEKDDVNTITVFPNPAISKLTVSYTGTTNCIEEVVITDISGRKIFTGIINSKAGKNENGVILPSILTKGIYFIKIGERIPVKFVKGGE